MITVQFEGGAELARALDLLPRQVSRTVQRAALRDAAEPMRRRMAQTAQHEPGKPDLRDTMTISHASGADDQETAVAVGPSRGGFYGSFLELGTKFIQARPFVRPAFDENIDGSLRIIAAALWTALASRGVSQSVTSPTVVQSPGALL